MRIHIRYADNRLDIFDTDTFTRTEPFDGPCMLTNFELRIDELGLTGLWLTAHYYDIAADYRFETAAGETPTAHRKRGWRFLLAEEGELAQIEGVTVDGQTVLMRIAGELADMVRFEQMCELWLSMADDSCVALRAVHLYERLCRAFPEDEPDMEKMARMCGFSAQAMSELLVWSTCLDGVAASEGEEEEWMEGINDEDVA